VTIIQPPIAGGLWLLRVRGPIGGRGEAGCIKIIFAGNADESEGC